MSISSFGGAAHYIQTTVFIYIDFCAIYLHNIWEHRRMHCLYLQQMWCETKMCKSAHTPYIVCLIILIDYLYFLPSGVVLSICAVPTDYFWLWL